MSDIPTGNGNDESWRFFERRRTQGSSLRDDGGSVVRIPQNGIWGKDLLFLLRALPGKVSCIPGRFCGRGNGKGATMGVLFNNAEAIEHMKKVEKSGHPCCG